MKDLHYTFTCKAAPVQAEGTICGRPFYFRARHDQWSFAVSLDPDIEPAEIDSQAPDAFYIEQKYDDGTFAASYLAVDEARLIIEKCAFKYLREQAA